MKTFTFDQGSPEWALARIGKPTASEFKRIVTTDGMASKSIPAYARELASEIFAGKTLDQFDGNRWSDRGKEMEAEALAFYEFAKEVTVTSVGFCTDDAETYGCSPDGLVGEDGGLEIKVRKAERHIEAVTYYAKHKAPPSGYIQQVQGALFVTGRAWWDLCFYSPELPPLIIRVTPDKFMHYALEKGIAEVLRERDAALATLRAA